MKALERNLLVGWNIIDVDRHSMIPLISGQSNLITYKCTAMKIHINHYYYISSPYQ